MVRVEGPEAVVRDVQPRQPCQSPEDYRREPEFSFVESGFWGWGFVIRVEGPERVVRDVQPRELRRSPQNYGRKPEILIL